MESTRELRLQIYKAMLAYGLTTKWAGFCYWSVGALNALGLEGEYPSFYHWSEDRENYYPELNRFDPSEDPEDKKTIWFPYTEEGYKTRYSILESVIQDMEEEK